MRLLLILLCGCTQHLDPCAGHPGPCVGVRLDSEVRPIDQIAVTLDGAQSRVTPDSPATLDFPVRFAVELPAGTTRAHLDFAGLRSGAEQARAGGDVNAGAELSLTLRSIFADLSMPADLTGADLAGADLAPAADLAGSDLAGADLAGADLASAADLATPDLLNAMYPVTFHYRGTGSGNLDVDGISCLKPDCTVMRPYGANVVLLANPNGASNFVAFTGACSATVPSCTFGVTGPSTVVVNFKSTTLASLTVVKIPISRTNSLLTVTPSPAPSGTCGTDCYLYTPGTNVTLTKSISNGVFLGWGGAECKFNQACTVQVNDDLGITASYSDVQLNYAFVTSFGYLPAELNVSGTPLLTADGLCQSVASSGGLPDSTSFRAWLSFSGTPASSRFGGAAGWVRTDGLPFTSNISDITGNARPIHPLALEENAKFVSGNVWTGTAISGQLGNNCSDWSDTSGSSAQIGTTAEGSEGWTASGFLQCDSSARLYCLGTARNQGLALTAPAGARLAFLSQQSSTGSASFDALCQQNANSQALGGSFRAYHARSTAPPLAVFDQTAGPWIRLDGALLAPIAARTQLEANDPQHLAPLHMRLNRAYAPQLEQAWIGNSVDNCTDWSSDAQAGLAHAVSRLRTSGVAPRSCTNPASFYCLQE